ncbi:MAG: DUF58 domain-containing protein [Myxococcota bacterium]
MQGAPRRPGEQLLPIDWGAITPLRLRAQLVADGAYDGVHRSRRRGAGVEFGGQRPYVAGDDLRFLDLRALLRHDRLMVREYETETERALWMCLDATGSMAFRGPAAPGAKVAYGALLAAALARIAIAGQDPVGLSFIGGGEPGRGVSVGFGHATFERVVSELECATAAGDLHGDDGEVVRAARMLDRRAARGGAIVVFSDFLDLPAEALRPLTALAAAPRALVFVQVLDPQERDLSFQGKVRLKALEGGRVVTTDADAVRARYQTALRAHNDALQAQVEAAGARWVETATDGDPVKHVRTVLRAIAEARR